MCLLLLSLHAFLVDREQAGIFGAKSPLLHCSAEDDEHLLCGLTVHPHEGPTEGFLTDRTPTNLAPDIHDRPFPPAPSGAMGAEAYTPHTT